MTTADTGPPQRARPRDRLEAGPDQRSETFLEAQYPTRHRQPWSHADALRRRREASYRLPPLESGRRDPWGVPR
jgi:hypothetical protein